MKHFDRFAGINISKPKWKSFIIYYEKLSGGFRYFDTYDNKIKECDTLPETVSRNRFFMFKGYEPNDESLLKFTDDFLGWVAELKENKVLNIDYTKYYSHHSAVELTFKRLCKNRYEDHQEIDLIESEWMEKCFNSGLMYCQTGTYESYGYDFSLFYPSILASEEFMIPTKKGKEVLLKQLCQWEKIQVGYYRVKITCKNDDFNKIFAFSKHNIYTHLSLKWALKNQEQFDVKIELFQDGKPNSYLFEKRDCKTGEYIFGDWYDKIIALRKLFPKNKLVKHIGSSLWGHLCKQRIINVKSDDIDSYDIGLDDKSEYQLIEHVTKSDKVDYYEIVETKRRYAYNLRIKAFLVAFGRNKIAEVAVTDIKNVVRIHTDGIVFKEPQKLDFENLISEDKTTGYIEWLNCNKYNKDERDEYIPSTPLFK
jgi:hypothetical protein